MANLYRHDCEGRLILTRPSRSRLQRIVGCVYVH